MSIKPKLKKDVSSTIAKAMNLPEIQLELSHHSRNQNPYLDTKKKQRSKSSILSTPQPIKNMPNGAMNQC